MGDGFEADFGVGAVFGGDFVGMAGEGGLEGVLDSLDVVFG